MSRFGIGMLTIGAFGMAALVACADTEESGDAPRDVPATGSVPNVDSGTTTADDAGVDGGGDATTANDAAPRTCSKEGFCHTTLPPKQSLRGVWADGNGIAWAVTEEGNILRFDGTTWKVHVNVPGPLHAIWGSGPTDVWIGTTTGLLHGTGASSNALVFTEVELPKGPVTAITSIWGTGPDDVWAVGGELSFPLVGRVLHWTGTEWALESIVKEDVMYQRVFGSATSGMWLAGRRNNPEQFWFDVTLLHRPVGGTEWEMVPLPLDPAVDGNPVGSLENLYDASISADGSAVFVMGRTHSATPAYVRGTDTGNGKWDFTFFANGKFGEPESHAIVASTMNDLFILGDYGRLVHATGSSFKQSLITVDKFPVIDSFYASFGKWFVGDDIALFHDPAKAQP